MSSISNLDRLIVQNLDYSSVKRVVGNSQQVMFCGSVNSHSNEIAHALLTDTEQSQIKEIFDFHIGEKSFSINKTMEGREIEKLYVYDEKQDKIMNRQGKAAITNMLLENFKREQEGLEPIPVIFFMDENKSFFGKDTTAEKMSSKEDKFNKLFINSQLRRCFKLYQELKDSDQPELRQMAEVARKMFKFVIVTNEKDKAVLKELPPIWDRKDVFEGMHKRADQSKNKNKGFNVSGFSGTWRRQLLWAAQDYNREKAKAQTTPTSEAAEKTNTFWSSLMNCFSRVKKPSDKN